MQNDFAGCVGKRPVECEDLWKMVYFCYTFAYTEDADKILLHNRVLEFAFK